MLKEKRKELKKIKRDLETLLIEREKAIDNILSVAYYSVQAIDALLDYTKKELKGK